MFKFFKWLIDRVASAGVAIATNETVKSMSSTVANRPALSIATLCAVPLIAVTIYFGTGGGSAVQIIEGDEVFGPTKPRKIAVQYLERAFQEDAFPSENTSIGRNIALDREKHGSITAIEIDYRDDHRRMEAQMAGMFGAEFQRDYDPDWNQEYRVDVVYSDGMVKSYMMRASRESGAWRIDSIW